jgi:hypothetical protein
MQTPNEMMASAIVAFELWRENKGHSAAKTPENLRQQAVALLDHFSSSKIVSALSLSGTGLKRWSLDDNAELTEFVTLPTIDNAAITSLNVELSSGNGCHMRLCGEISPAQLTAITQTVTAHSRATS